ncbi:helix-turn-helix transcriptional regulator [Methylocystis echinoides]|uniref:HTH cro/C1-type domain-containing protein n=1 Tax=Methylocystis echinoides TaxID=29468 RepID=A0A9W6GQM1_9HYPH|nr:helix-turn-helix transcriptional regulator [Methylocystis echinoides]GLI91095.1 hypothetical protein LMG27198_00870 [Methylocystis echinoides]
MTKNNIKTMREKKGLSRKALADLVGASRQQIHRIEAGVQSVRFDLALAICDALEAELTDVFPAVKAALARASRGQKPSVDRLRDEKAREDLEKAGFDMDPEIWIFRFRLRGGTAEDLQVSGPDKRRLWGLVQNNEGFAVFDSGNCRYAINLALLQFCQFQFEAPFPAVRQALARRADEIDPEPELLLRFIDRVEPERFSVDRDGCSIGDANANYGDVQIQTLFASAESREEDRFLFTDMDDESVFFSLAAVSMFAVPLRLVEPALYEGTDEAETEEE